MSLVYLHGASQPCQRQREQSGRGWKQVGRGNGGRNLQQLQKPLYRLRRNHHGRRVLGSSLVWVLFSVWGHLLYLRATRQVFLGLLEGHTPMRQNNEAMSSYLSVTPSQQGQICEWPQQDSQKKSASITEAWTPVLDSLFSCSVTNSLFSVSWWCLFNWSCATLLNKTKHSYSLHMLLNTATLK